ncbi:MAG: transglycosylase SLT domain-containing protein [Oligoflexia bacterium]|nr:transglycosylase SLT domain-containing protein [Oligoflexia bacterium]
MRLNSGFLSNFCIFILLPILLLVVAYTFDAKENLSAETKPVVSESYLKNFNDSFSGTLPIHTDSINRIPLEYVDQTITSQHILDDSLNKISEEFKVSGHLKKRTSFWIDIYSKYSSRFVLIHDQLRPWIVYKVVDTRDIYEKNSGAATKEANDRILVKKSIRDVRKALLKMEKRKDYSLLSSEEEKYFNLFKNIPGSKRLAFKMAAKSLRAQRGQKDFFRSGLVNGSKYLHEMEGIFAKHDVPIEITKLPLVESSFNEKAVSRVGASGVWQFMPAMGKKYLKITPHTDERNSPIKATEAAAKLLKSNYKILKTWPLAITAYNHGATGLVKAKKLLKTDDLEEIIENYKGARFSFSSQNFYSEFLAALHVETYQEFVFGTLDKPKPLAADSLKLKQKIRVNELAKIAGVTLEEIKLHNPDLKKRVVKSNPFLPAGYTVRLPIGSLERIEKGDAS